MERPPAAAHFCLSNVQENCNRVDGKNIKFRFVELMEMLDRSLHQQQMETRHLTRGCEFSRFKCLPQRRLCPLHLELGVEGSMFVYGFSVKGVGFLISAFHCHCSFLNQCALFNYLFFPPYSPPRYFLLLPIRAKCGCRTCFSPTNARDTSTTSSCPMSTWESFQMDGSCIVSGKSTVCVFTLRYSIWPLG